MPIPELGDSPDNHRELECVKGIDSPLLGLEHHWFLHSIFATSGLEPESVLQSYLVLVN